MVSTVREVLHLHHEARGLITKAIGRAAREGRVVVLEIDGIGHLVHDHQMNDLGRVFDNLIAQHEGKRVDIFNQPMQTD